MKYQQKFGSTIEPKFNQHWYQNNVFKMPKSFQTITQTEPAQAKMLIWQTNKQQCKNHTRCD